jgi:two-component system sensor histidine kinase RegB
MSVAVLALVGVNLFTWQRLRLSTAVSGLELFGQLLIDATVLTVQLYYSGGATNPFVLMYLLPITLAAAALPGIFSGMMAVFTAICYSILMFNYVPMPHTHTLHGSQFDLHVIGMWFGFVVSGGLTAYFVVKMGQTLRERDAVLAAMREEQLRNERILALGTLATGAAHELGTPLSTMAVLLKEMENDVKADTEMTAQLGILRSQVNRCKQILSSLSASAGHARAEAGSGMPLDEYLQKLLEDWRTMRPAVRIEVTYDGLRPAPRILTEQTLSQAIINILNNAADASPEQIEMEARWDRETLRIEIRDRGPGLAPAVEKNAGTPFFTTKEPGQGLGLGLFLAHATLNRFGSKVELYNREGGGACTRLALPLSQLLVSH